MAGNSTSAPVRPATATVEAFAGKTLYQSPPAAAPSGKPAIAACCASACAATGPSESAPGVHCRKAAAPMPAETSEAASSATASRASP